MSKREMRHPSNGTNEVRTENRFERRGSDSELIKKTEDIKRDAMGRFGHGGRGGPRAGAGRPKGSQNKTSLQIKEAILSALNKLGGDDYLVALGRENSSAFASLLSKVLPTQLAPASESDGGAGVQVVFRREIVWPGGRTEIDGVTPPKALPPPDPTHDTSDQA